MTATMHLTPSTHIVNLFHAVNFSPSTACPQEPFTFPATAVILCAFILLLSTVDPIGTGGHRNPNRGTLPDETGHQSVTVNSPFLFPSLSFSYFISLLFDFPLPFLFPLGFFSCTPFFWEWPSPKKQPRGDSSFSRADRDRPAQRRGPASRYSGKRVPCGDLTRATPLLSIL